MIVGSRSAVADNIKTPHLDPRAELLDASLGPIRWDAPPPIFVWMTRGLLDWQPEGSPEIGELWYGPWHGLRPSNSFETLSDQIERLGPQPARNCRSGWRSMAPPNRLPDRMAD